MPSLLIYFDRVIKGVALKCCAKEESKYRLNLQSNQMSNKNYNSVIRGQLRIFSKNPPI